MKKKSVITIIAGAFITVLSIALPYIVGLFIHLFPEEASAGVGIIGGAGWPTAFFKATEALGSMPFILMIIGLLCLVFGVVFAVISSVMKAKGTDGDK